jgi:hypothetical protein
MVVDYVGGLVVRRRRRCDDADTYICRADANADVL